eukprot:6214433-Pleurochrysis_carterae.AAC.1
MSALRWRVVGKCNRGGYAGQWRRCAAPQLRLNSLSSAPSIACTRSSQRRHCSRVLKECAPLHPRRPQSKGSNGRPHSSAKLYPFSWQTLSKVFTLQAEAPSVAHRSNTSPHDLSGPSEKLRRASPSHSHQIAEVNGDMLRKAFKIWKSPANRTLIRTRGGAPGVLTQLSCS